MSLIRNTFAALALLSLATTASATKLSFWDTDGWTEMTQTGGYGDGIVDPGAGGQAFDVEYLLYKFDASTNTLSIGLQTGFNIVDGAQKYGQKMYYNGDLALSFDGDKSGYEYAVDFGNYTENYYHTSLGTDAAGLYSVDSWNNGIYFQSESSPFAMASGNLLTSGSMQEGKQGDSYFNTFSFNVGALGLSSSTLNLDAHWTMSCGNDFLDAGTTITTPEPGSIALLGLGLLGLLACRRRLHA